jgi:vancomycin resistance protein VanW
MRNHIVNGIVAATVSFLYLAENATPAYATARDVTLVQVSGTRMLNDQAKIPNPVTPDLPPVGQKIATQLNLIHLLAQRTTNFNHASASQTKNIELVAQRLNGTLVKAGQVFSYFKQVGPYTVANGYHWGRAFSGDRIVPSIGGGVCQGASTLYSTLLRTGLPIIERHSHSLTVPYLPPGEDAAVASTYKDLKFLNNLSTPVLITASCDPNKRYLTIAIWSAVSSRKITVKHEILERYPYRTLQRHSPTVPPGEANLLFPGQLGVKVKTWLEIQTEQGVKKKYVGVDTYRPSPRIIEVGRG